MFLFHREFACELSGNKPRFALVTFTHYCQRQKEKNEAQEDNDNDTERSRERTVEEKENEELKAV